MKKTRLVASGVLTLGLLAAFTPSALAGQARTSSVHWGSVSGTLQTYTPGSNATLGVSSGHKAAAIKSATLKVGLSFHTKLRYAGKHHAAPFPASGDTVQVTLKWHGNSARATAVTYVDHGALSSAGSHGEDGTSRFHGAYDAADSSTSTLALTVDGGTVDSFALTSNTVYFENGQQVASPTLTDGERLAVEATQESDGSWSADAVVIGDHHGDRGGDGQSDDFSGLYQSNTASTLTLSDEDGNDSRTFTVDTNTTYYDQSGNQVSSLTYSAAERLHVTATEQTDGTWLASKVSVDDGHGHGGGDHGGDGENHQFRGAYVSSDATTLVVTNHDGESETFTVDSNTLYFDQNGNPAASLAYTAGETLYITAARQADGTWLASQVSEQAPSGHDGGGHGDGEDFGGAYQSDTPTSLTLTDEDGGAVVFMLDANTKYFDQSGKPAASLTYTAGEHLHVQAAQQTDGSWLATLVSAFDKHDD